MNRAIVFCVLVNVVANCPLALLFGNQFRLHKIIWNAIDVSSNWKSPIFVVLVFSCCILSVRVYLVIGSGREEKSVFFIFCFFVFFSVNMADIWEFQYLL